MFLSSHKHFKKSFYTGRVDFTSKTIQERNEVIKEISVHQTKRHEHSTAQHPTAPAQAEPIWYKKHRESAPEEIFGEQVIFLTSLLHELMQKKNQNKTPRECLAWAARTCRQTQQRVPQQDSSKNRNTLKLQFLLSHVLGESSSCNHPSQTSASSKQLLNSSRQGSILQFSAFPRKCGWAGSGCCVQRAPAPLPVPTVMLGTPAQPHLSQGMELVKLTCQGALISSLPYNHEHKLFPALLQWQLYRKLPPPQLQLELFPPRGSELEPQLFKRMRGPGYFSF